MKKNKYIQGICNAINKDKAVIENIYCVSFNVIVRLSPESLLVINEFIRNPEPKIDVRKNTKKIIDITFVDILELG